MIKFVTCFVEGDVNWFDWWFRSPDERLAAGGELHPHTGTDLSVPADCVAAAQVDA